MSDRRVRKLKDRAVELCEKERYDEALEIYQTLCGQHPKDTALMLKVGELNHLTGRNRAAIDTYSRAVDRFAKDGMLLKGIAVCKIILDIDPRNRDVVRKLETLYASQYGALPVQRPLKIDGEPSSLRDRSDHVPDVAVDVDVDLSDIARADDGTLPVIPLLSDLDKNTFVSLLSRVPLHRYDSEEIVIKEDEIGNSFFILVEGDVRVVKSPDILLATLGAGSFFGEMAVVAPRRRRATVVTSSPSEILEITRPDLDGLTAVCPKIYTTLAQFTEQRLLQNLMVTSPLFAPFAPDERERLVARFENKKYLRGQPIIEQHKQTEGLYLIASGSVDVERNNDVIASLTDGEMFGEISLLLRSSATATVRATTNTRVLLLPRSVFNELIMTHPQILELVNDLREERLCLPEHETSLPRELVSELDGGSAFL